jgi:hypothetical protein
MVIFFKDDSSIKCIMGYTLFRTVKNYLRKPYDLLRDGRVKFLFSVVFPFVVFALLWFLGPFGLALFPDKLKFKLVLLDCVFGSLIIAVHLYLLQKIIIKTYNIGVTIVWLAWIHCVIALSNMLIYVVVAGDNRFKGLIIVTTSTCWKYFPRILFQTCLIGLIPTAAIILLFNSFVLRKKIKIVNQINSDLPGRPKNIPAKNDVTISASNLREVITLDANSLTYISVEDNYIDVHWLVNGLDKHRLLRNTLSKIEKDIARQFPFIKRCHHGYIVNTNRIKSLDGNEAGYKILLDGVEFPVPISRKYKNTLLRHLKQ